MKNLVLRTLTGSIYVIVVVGGIVGGFYPFLTLFSVITVVCLWEFYGLINRQRRMHIHRPYHCLGGLLLFLTTCLYTSGIASPAIFLIYVMYLASVFVLELYEKQSDPITHSAAILLGHAYITLPLSMLALLAFPFGSDGGSYYPMLMLALMVFIWMNDTGAYLVGTLFGKHRLLERISPKKSWEGFFGGLFFTVVSSLVFAHFERNIPLLHWAGLALVVAIFATWGDLVESLIKRTLGVKDSGKTLPGHGGFLDRFDSLLLAVYAALIYVQTLMGGTIG
jgi:phosphatidate cytidylyltransferase